MWESEKVFSLLLVTGTCPPIPFALSPLHKEGMLRVMPGLQNATEQLQMVTLNIRLSRDCLHAYIRKSHSSADIKDGQWTVYKYRLNTQFLDQQDGSVG